MPRKGLLHRIVLERIGKGIDLGGGYTLCPKSLAPGPISQQAQTGAIQDAIRSHPLFQC